MPRAARRCSSRSRPTCPTTRSTAIARLAVELGLAGLIATNTTISRDGLVTDPAVVAAAGAGGLSGAPLQGSRARGAAARARGRARGVRVISAGGVETAADVRERLDAGATLVQGYTAFLYRGPAVGAGRSTGGSPQRV